jgi:uncharacterized BrkB/YihY/UPF0761 family membrane protein
MIEVKDLFKIGIIIFIFLFFVFYFLNPTFVQNARGTDDKCKSCAPNIMKISGVSLTCVIIFASIYYFVGDDTREKINDFFGSIISLVKPSSENDSLS